MKSSPRDESPVVCSTCECGILDHEERGMQSLTGAFGCHLTYWHADDKACVRALLEKVRQMETTIARQAVKLDALLGKE